MNGTIFPIDDGDIYGPRWYMPGTLALQALAFKPREQLSRKQPEGTCPEGQGSCIELNQFGICCEINRYCYFDGNWEPRCCPAGLKCPDSPCQADEFYCNVTTSKAVRMTLTLEQTTTGTSAASKTEKIITAFISHYTTASCCSRACGASSYSCESVFGGHCCGFGSQCALGTSCVADTRYKKSSCLPTQITCEPSEGGGCCNTGSVCAVIRPTPTFACKDRGPILEDHVAGLSPSAKAGIGVGVAIGAVVIIAVVAYLSIWRRRSNVWNEKILTEDNQDRSEFADRMVETTGR
ncbi:hypothetical protein EV127DRAFT_195396 [Xylaria flabelliformis]|nr:hypothetical protein EV127DRAFT_195396 [Xylaria flabelliformis]